MQRNAGPSDGWLTVLHESGHALGHVIAQGKVPVEMAYEPGRGGACLAMHPDKGSTWEPNADGGKRVLAAVTNGLKPSAHARRTFKPSLIALLCGEVAQRKAGWDRSDEYHRNCCSDDRDKLVRVLGAITENQADFDEMLHDIATEARHIIDRHWDVIEELAHDLMEFKRLDERAIKHICGDLCPIKEEVEKEESQRSVFRDVDDDVLQSRALPRRERDAFPFTWDFTDRELIYGRRIP
jgi:hypothetical protein